MTVRLVILDVDGTILKTLSWQHLHEQLGTLAQAKLHQTQFTDNQITYSRWAQLDAALWKDQPLTRIRKIIMRMPYTDGARQTIATLKHHDVNVYLLSAGLTRVAQRIQKETGADGYTANTLMAKNGRLNGEVEVSVAFHNKDTHLPRILQRFDLRLEQCAAVGDDPTLIPLFKKVGLAIAFNPTSKEVEKHADVIIKNQDLRTILRYTLGTHKQHQA
jgi:HAD superfamily phosphoserine phosphatase-like hydrolase